MPWPAVIVEKHPAKYAREKIGGHGHGIMVGSHMVQEIIVRPPPINPRSAAINAIGIVMPLATGVAIALRSIH
jgi:hypothetical protein